jgi:MFS family permease
VTPGPAVAESPRRPLAIVAWWTTATHVERRALVAASLGWMFTAFDVMLYALVLVAVMTELGMSRATAGLLGSLTLIASAVGGGLFGVVADRFGRTVALAGAIAMYSAFTGASGFAQTVLQLAVFRVLLGIGMGGDWASGAALVSETWRAEHRGKALGFMQSAWAIGYGLAAIVTAIILPWLGWRAVFFVGFLPILLALWILRRVEEPELWHRTRSAKRQPSAWNELFRGPAFRVTLAVTFMNACTMFAWWGFNLWIPAYLVLPVEEGGIGLSPAAMSGLVVAMQVGMWLGYVSFGFISDAVGRKRTYVAYLLAATVFTLAYTATDRPVVLLALGPFVAFFGTGYFSGFGAVTAELYHTSVRATAQGITYNSGRIASALAPFLVGTLAQSHGFGAALSLSAAAFALAALTWIWIPETRGRALV